MNKLLQQIGGVVCLVFGLSGGLWAQSNTTPCAAKWLNSVGEEKAQSPTPNYQLTTQYKTCGGLTEENPLWYQFVPKAGSVTFMIRPTNCIAGKDPTEVGVSVTPYRSRAPYCGDLVTLGTNLCKNIRNLETESITLNVNPGRINWLQIDGLVGSQCDFAITYNPSELSTQYARWSAQLFLDNDNDCQKGSNETNAFFEEIIVLLKQGNSVIYTLRPSSKGLIESDVVLGAYDVEIRFPNNLWKTCAITKLDFAEANKILSTNLPIQEAKKCSVFTTDLTTFDVQNVKNNQYQLKFKNLGTAQVNNARAVLDIDEKQSLVTANKVYTRRGNTYIFELGNLNALESGQIEFSTKNETTLEANRAIIHKVSMTPNPLCDTPSSSWSKAEIEVYGACRNDSVFFAMRNAGTGPSDALSSIIIEDEVIGTLQVAPASNSLDSFVVAKFVATGKTYRFEVPQVAGYPRLSMPSVTIEGCRKGNTGTISTGFAAMFPQDDAAPNIDIDIREVTTPNQAVREMLAFPKGVESKFIGPNQDVEFLIRYQNKSNFLVNRLTIVDTLPVGFNIATLQMGATSHPANVAIAQNNTLIFSFENLNLMPNGVPVFVKFRISQQKDLIDGTTLAHRSAFFVDTEDNPLIGNTVTQVIKRNYMRVKANEVFEPNLQVNVFPNPTNTEAHIRLKNIMTQRLKLEVIDIAGRVLHSKESDNNEFDVSVGDFPHGFYFFRIRNAKGSVLANGKIEVLK